MPSTFYPTPEITAIYPGRLGTDIPLDPTFQISYDRELDESTVTASNILLENMATDAAITIANLAYSYKTITFKASSPLTSNTRYRVTLKSGIKSLQGVSQEVNKSWEFTTATATALSAPVLTSPADQSGVELTPTFSWGAVSGAHHYEIQVSTTPKFVSVYWPTLALDPTGTSVTPGTAFTSDATYYWRVRAVAVASNPDPEDYSDWSDIWSFYLGTTDRPTPDSQVDVDPDAGEFYITKTSPTNAGTHLRAGSWVVTFNHNVNSAYVTSDYITVTKCTLDGVPDSTNTVGGTLTYSANTITFTPSSTELESGTSYFKYNTEYIMTVSRLVRDTDGNLLDEDQVLWFTSSYVPLYLNWETIKLDLGDFIRDYPPDIINRFIHHVSMDVQRIRMALPDTYYPDLMAVSLYTLKEVKDNTIAEVDAYDVLTYVRAMVEYRILQRKIFEFLEHTDSRRVLGDLTIAEANVSLLAEMRRMKDEVKKTADESSAIIGIWTRGVGRPRFTQKARLHLPYPWHWRSLDYGQLLAHRYTGAPTPAQPYNWSPSFVPRTLGDF